MSLSPVGITSPRLDPEKRMSFSFRDSTLQNTKGCASYGCFFLMVKKNLRSMVTLRLICLKIILRHLLDFCVYQSEGS